MASADKISFLALAIAVVALAFAGMLWREGRMPRPASEQQGSAISGEWLRGTPNEQLRTVEKQLRGLDVAMAEVGYRFTDLYFAGQDGNWGYAKYQAEKIDLTVRLALERRPKRAASAQPFLNEDLPYVQKAISSRDAAGFEQAMNRLRTACMKCHTNENVPYFTVEFPERRISPVRTIR